MSAPPDATGLVAPIKRVPLRFQVSSRTLASVSLRLLVHSAPFSPSAASDASTLSWPPAEFPAGCDGHLFYSRPVSPDSPAIRREPHALVYVASRYSRYYIDMTQDFPAYEARFSSKSRSTMRRKERRFAAHCGGQVDFRVYRRPDELDEFYRLARPLSALTYQERLLDAGLPLGEEFRARMHHLALADRVRAFLLCHDTQPVAYLYCPVTEAGVVVYAYLGYHPEYAQWSVGTILHWRALQSLFAEKRFRVFDFTEGENDTKRLFATGRQFCADVFVLRPTLPNRVLVTLHHGFNNGIARLRSALPAAGLRASLRRWLRA